MKRARSLKYVVYKWPRGKPSPRSLFFSSSHDPFFRIAASFANDYCVASSSTGAFTTVLHRRWSLQVPLGVDLALYDLLTDRHFQFTTLQFLAAEHYHLGCGLYLAGHCSWTCLYLPPDVIRPRNYSWSTAFLWSCALYKLGGLALALVSQEEMGAI